MMKSLTTMPSGSAADFGVADGEGPPEAVGDGLGVALCNAVGLGCELDAGPGPQLTTRKISSGAAPRIRGKRRPHAAVTPNSVYGREPAGSTSRLMVLLRGPFEFQDSRNVQQPAVGTSVMLGPPGIVTTGCDSPSG
jgi:hypothetical protein